MKAWCAAALAIAAAALASCNSTPPPSVCPGEVVTKLRFQSGQPTSSTSCPAAGMNPVAFTGTLAFGDGDEAHLCPDRAEAAPLTGHHVGDHFVLGGTPVPTTLDACSCPLTVTEVLDGNLVRTGGAVTGFQGTLTDSLAAASGDASACGSTTSCGVPCDGVWDVQGAP